MYRQLNMYADCMGGLVWETQPVASYYLIGIYFITERDRIVTCYLQTYSMALTLLPFALQILLETFSDSSGVICNVIHVAKMCVLHFTCLMDRYSSD